MATKGKVASQMPLKAIVTSTSSEDDEDTASGFVITRKRGRDRVATPVPSPSRGQAASNTASPPQPSNIPP